MKMVGLLMVPLLLQVVNGSPQTSSLGRNQKLQYTLRNWTDIFYTTITESLPGTERYPVPETAPTNEVVTIITSMKEKISQIEDDQKEIMEYLNQIETLLKLRRERNRSSPTKGKPIVPYIKHVLNTSGTSKNLHSMSETLVAEKRYQSWQETNSERKDKLFSVQP